MFFLYDKKVWIVERYFLPSKTHLKNRSLTSFYVVNVWWINFCHIFSWQKNNYLRKSCWPTSFIYSKNGGKKVPMQHIFEIFKTTSMPSYRLKINKKSFAKSKLCFYWILNTLCAIQITRKMAAIIRWMRLQTRCVLIFFSPNNFFCNLQLHCVHRKGLKTRLRS